jgi:hypothetical protein
VGVSVCDCVIVCVCVWVYVCVCVCVRARHESFDDVLGKTNAEVAQKACACLYLRTCQVVLGIFENYGWHHLH